MLLSSNSNEYISFSISKYVGICMHMDIADSAVLPSSESDQSSFSMTLTLTAQLGPTNKNVSSFLKAKLNNLQFFHLMFLVICSRKPSIVQT